MTFDKAYATLATKYKLPKFDDLNNELELISIESEHFPLREVRLRMAEHLEAWIEVLEGVISPDQSKSSALYESRFFTEKERNAVFDTYKQIMRHLRALDEALVTNDDALDAQTIKDVWKDWEHMKEQVLMLVRKLKESWDKELHGDNSHVGYLG